MCDGGGRGGDPPPPPPRRRRRARSERTGEGRELVEQQRPATGRRPVRAFAEFWRAGAGPHLSVSRANRVYYNRSKSVLNFQDDKEVIF